MKSLPLGLLAGLTLFGQPAPAPPAFEVAAIHALTGPYRALMTMKISGTLVTLEGYNLKMFVSEAYGVKFWQIFADSVPTAAQDTFYTVEARTAGGPSREDMRAMLRTLLADRFHLALHRETRKIPVYALVVDKKGPLLKPGTGDADCASSMGPVKPTDRNYRYRFTNCTIDPLANNLQADRPIVNETGLTGRYDISIFATPAFRMRDVNEPGDIAAGDAVKQLGLRLEAENAPIDVIVIDHADARPTAN